MLFLKEKQLKKISVFLVLLFVFILPKAFSLTDAKIGFYERIRYEYWKNIFTLNDNIKDDRSFFRFKTSLSCDFQTDDLKLMDMTRFFVKLTNENKAYSYYMSPANPTADKHRSFDIDEIVFDNMYFEFKDIAGAPLDIKVGRQDMIFMYTGGFLIMDGTPLDGSRTYYFNAAKLRWKVEEDNNVDFVFISDPQKEQYLPLISRAKEERSLNYSDETAFMVDWKQEPVDDALLEMYYIYKTEGSGGVKFQSKAGHINTLGSYLNFNFPFADFKLQGAYQFGEYGQQKRQGFGGYAFFEKSWDEIPCNPLLCLGYIYLSGDDNKTNAMEAWDPLFSRWPWMSELYVLYYNSESGMGYWTNLQMLRSKIFFEPTEKISISLGYNLLFANENVNGAMFSEGKFRGQLPQFRIDYNLNENMKMYLLCECFFPGNFYDSNYQDAAIFLRTEFSVKF